MNILHVIGYLGKAQGGPVESLRLLASAQAEMGNRVRVVYTGIPGDGELSQFPVNVDVAKVGVTGPTRWAPKFQNTACGNGFSPNVVHSHGLWLDASRQAAKLSVKLDVPHILSPCGMLQQDALQISRWKKQLLWFAFQKGALLSAAAVHAKSDAEASGIKKILPNIRATIIPGPVQPPPKGIISKDNTDRGSVKETMFQRFGILSSHKVLLFMGRIHPVKGLERLLDAWVRLFENFPDWRLVIVGPNEDGYREKLTLKFNGTEATKGANGKDNTDMWSTVAFMDPLYGEDRWEVYGNADLFVAPSDFENFGHSIAEALSAGLPVITTTGTPWGQLKEKKCGWWVEPSQETIASALEEAMRLSDSERRAKGGICKQLVQEYHPRKIAQKMCALYESLLNERVK